MGKRHTKKLSSEKISKIIMAHRTSKPTIDFLEMPIPCHGGHYLCLAETRCQIIQGPVHLMRPPSKNPFQPPPPFRYKPPYKTTFKDLGFKRGSYQMNRTQMFLPEPLFINLIMIGSFLNQTRKFEWRTVYFIFFKESAHDPMSLN